MILSETFLYLHIFLYSEILGLLNMKFKVNFKDYLLMKKITDTRINIIFHEMFKVPEYLFSEMLEYFDQSLLF